MSKLIKPVASNASNRDMERLEPSILKVLIDVLRPRLVRIYHLLRDRDGLAVRLGMEGDAGGVRYTAGGAGNPWLSLNTFPEQKALLERNCGGPITSTVVYFVRTMQPIFNGHETIGWVEIDTETPLSLADAKLLAGLLKINAHHLAIVDANQKDPLTGLLHRKAFEEAFHRLGAPIERLLVARRDDDRRQAPADDHTHWFGVVDIEHFKSINDRLGHLDGDEVLILFARTMQATYHATDQLFRFGGEEFAILLRQVCVLDARGEFERLRTRVESLLVPGIGPITVSIGYAMIRIDDSPIAVYRRADEALHYAKQHGRNRTCSYERLLRAGDIRSRPQIKVDAELFERRCNTFVQ
ncbi:MAG: GGDEF domain-containing protein [Betaproteobacteria bacterium]|nr:GGDEF domain-containing protein [Betaproteobacteria bacterium]